MFTRTQVTLDGTNSTKRQLQIPGDIHKFAVLEKMQVEQVAGQGRRNLPTLPDIYHALATEGLEMVYAGDIVPVFTEIGLPKGARSAQIKFDIPLQNGLVALRTRAEAGEFDFGPYKEISLISIAVNLMQLAMEKRQKQKQ